MGTDCGRLGKRMENSKIIYIRQIFECIILQKSTKILKLLPRQPDSILQHYEEEVADKNIAS